MEWTQMGPPSSLLSVTYQLNGFVNAAAAATSIHFPGGNDVSLETLQRTLWSTSEEKDCSSYGYDVAVF
ncbi:hypothetical protein AAFF_G00322150 [Aldrovandia affinis]|uniref:Uncharacterized protein n=1 Tax=Aldrovandia affinis TaxID=143900 RepID=A0AAD7WR19_9TELE|nr:hypothetical protein AAFF_G00322150 [Aldrovandia affinis]